MNAHNIMEDFVIQRINELFEQISTMNTNWFTCGCEHCKTDVAAYVLNRIPPKYVVSGRGSIYYRNEIDAQNKADIDSLIFEGAKIVNSIKRPYHTENTVQEHIEGWYFNFPTFIGNVYDGDTFEPLTNAEVVLMMDNEKAEMIDISWFNPCITDKRTNCTYSFLVKPQVASEKETKDFNFTLKISAPNYETCEYGFNVYSIAEKNPKKNLNTTYSLKIQDLFLFLKKN